MPGDSTIARSDGIISRIHSLNGALYALRSGGKLTSCLRIFNCVSSSSEKMKSSSSQPLIMQFAISLNASSARIDSGASRHSAREPYELTKQARGHRMARQRHRRSPHRTLIFLLSFFSAAPVRQLRGSSLNKVLRVFSTIPLMIAKHDMARSAFGKLAQLNQQELAALARCVNQLL